MEDVQPPAKLSRLDVGMLITLISVGLAGVIGLIAVLDADSDIAAIGTGLGMALLVFQTGATIACALACLARQRLELLALGGLAAACLAVDLFAPAILLEIDDETYAKIAGSYVWAFFGLIVLGLALATQPLDRLARGPGRSVPRCSAASWRRRWSRPQVATTS